MREPTTKTAMTDNTATELDSMVASGMHGFGKIAATGAVDYIMHLAIPVATAATDGTTWDLYMAKSMDDTEWSIESPTATGNVTAPVLAGDLIAQLPAGGTASGSATDHYYFNLKTWATLEAMPPYFGFFLRNSSTQLATVGFDADYVSVREIQTGEKNQYGNDV